MKMQGRQEKIDKKISNNSLNIIQKILKNFVFDTIYNPRI